jgi:hypothetical protein
MPNSNKLLGNKSEASISSQLFPKNTSSHSKKVIKKKSIKGGNNYKGIAEKLSTTTKL